MPICRKCQSSFPNLVNIDGKTKNLCNRKFCLECSPFGTRNTKPDDPARKSVFGQKDYKKESYSKWNEEVKALNRARTWKRGEERKQKLIDLKGGSCKECGYKRCSRSLSFHHRDPSQKSFALDTRAIRGLKWETLLQEVEKCDLLCLNCHMEFHAETESIYRSILDR